MTNRAVDNLTSYFNLTEQTRTIATNLLESYKSEAMKGCTGKIYDFPLASIEPQFDYFTYRNNCGDDPLEPRRPRQSGQSKIKAKEIIFNPQGSDDFNSQVFSTLAQLKKPITYEVELNETSCLFRIIGTDNSLSYMTAAIKSSTSGSKLLDVPLRTFSVDENISSHSFYPSGPYFRSLTTDIGKINNILLSLLQKSTYLQEGQKLLFRVKITPAFHGWVKNCVNLHQFEERCYTLNKEQNQMENYFLNPALEGKRAISQKVNPETQPLFFVLPTLITVGDVPSIDLLSSFMQNYRFGDYPYKSVTYDNEIALDIVNNDSSYIHGHLLNRAEASSLVLFPCDQCFTRYKQLLMPRPEKTKEEGITLGDNSFGDSVILPFSAIPQSCTLIGTQGFGKTNLLLNCLQDVVRSKSPKYGLISFYFHDLFFIQNLISIIPEERLHDVIIARPGMNGRILGRNLTDSEGEDPFRKAAALAYAIEQSSITFGIDVKYYIKNGLGILLTLNSTSFEDLLYLFDLDEPRGHYLRATARSTIPHRNVQKFLNKIERDRGETTKVVNKLQDLFDEEQTQKMLAYTGKNILSYKEVITNQQILLWYLGGLGSAGDALASMEVTAIHKTFQGFSNVEGRIPHFPTLCVIDEAQRIRAGGMEESIREDRKFGLSYLISTQSLNGLSQELVNAINNMKNLGFFQCPDYDARFFSKSVGGIITPQDIMFLEKYTLYMRMLTANNVQLVKTRKFQPGDLEKYNFVVQNSFENYYIDTTSEEVDTAPTTNSLSQESRNTIENLF